MRIGVIDSGIGGLTVLASLLKNCPNHEYIYYGDTIHLPYGNKKYSKIIKYGNEIIKFLEKKEVDLIVIACGTLSSNKKYLKSNVPLIDVLSPLKGKLDKYREISIIATELSVKINSFKDYINTKINLISCPLLVPIIESDNYQNLDNILERYLKDTKKSEALILGCTHYPIIKEYIAKYFKKDIISLDAFVIEEIRTLPTSRFKLTLYFSKINKTLEGNVKRILKMEDVVIERSDLDD